MARGVRLRTSVLATALAIVLPASSAHAANDVITATDHERGWVALTVRGDDGQKVDLYERVGDQTEALGSVTIAGGKAVLRHAAPWRCDRYVRHFYASTSSGDLVLQTEAAPIRTPSCRHRLALRFLASKHSRTRRVVGSIIDRWRVGDVSFRLCLLRPGHAKFACKNVTMRAGNDQVFVVRPARASGLWTVVVGTAWKQVEVAHAYVRPKRKLRLLATGDSMIQVVDSYLKRRLAPRGFKVRSDARISTGISKPFLLNWPNLAKRQAHGVRPDVTVVFIGANDGFPFGKVDCCGDAWVDAYASRVRSMMVSYARKSRGLVYWLTLPAPRPAQWRSVYPAVNRAIKRAAKSLAGTVRVIDIAKVLTPNGRFRSQMTWHGHRVTVRQGDGVHLSTEGASIAETLIQRALRRDRVIG